MTMQFSATDRTALGTTLVTQLGGSATMRFYTGARPTPAAWTAGTPNAVLTFGATAVTDANGGSAGGVASGVITFGGYTQTSSSFVAGTPTWVALVTSGGRCVATVDIGSGSTSIAFSGAIVNGQNVTGTLTLAASNV